MQRVVNVTGVNSMLNFRWLRNWSQPIRFTDTVMLEISCLYIKVSMVNDFLVSHMLFWGKKQNPQTALVNWFL